MKQHAIYWAGLLDRGRAIAFGPVADPKGAWGMGLVRADTEAELRALQAGDPALKIGMHYESHLMPRLVFRDARG